MKTSYLNLFSRQLTHTRSISSSLASRGVHGARYNKRAMQAVAHTSTHAALRSNPLQKKLKYLKTHALTRKRTI